MASIKTIKLIKCYLHFYNIGKMWLLATNDAARIYKNIE